VLAAVDSVADMLQELRLKVLALRAYNLETMLIGEHVKSREPIVTQIRSGPFRVVCRREEASRARQNVEEDE